MAHFARRMDYRQSTAGVIRYLFESMTVPETISFGGAAPCDIHEERRDVMVARIQTLLPRGIKYVYPDGGLFMEGQPVRDNCMRISFGGVTAEKIRGGMNRLASVIKARL